MIEFFQYTGRFGMKYKIHTGRHNLWAFQVYLKMFGVVIYC